MSDERVQGGPAIAGSEASDDRRLDEMVELRVRRILSELESNREKAIIESLQSQRDFLIGNTKWVVTGFFGLLIVFGALVTFVFGSQIDDRYFDAVIGESLSENVETKIAASIEAQSRESLSATRIDIQSTAQQELQKAVNTIEEAVDIRVQQILSDQVLQKIEEAQSDFLSRTSQEIVDGLMPPEAVLAFDRAEGCPAGWAEFEGASNRFILGAHQDRIPFRDIGGAETHTLTIAEMPAHEHAVPFVPEVSSLSGGSYPVMSSLRHPSASRVQESVVTSSSGSTRPHNNMPPYIALYFCKKESG